MTITEPTCAWCGAEQHAVSRGNRDSLVILGCIACGNPLAACRDSGNGWATLDTGLQDFRELAQQGSVMANVFEGIGAHLDTLPALPEAAQRAVMTLHDPLASVGELSEVLQRDAVMSAEVLRMANSAMFAGTQPIGDLRTACTRLGVRALAHIITAHAVKSYFKPRDTAAEEVLGRFWAHSMAVAICAVELRRHVPDEQRGWLFLSGLVHDIGKPVLLDYVHNHHKGSTGRLGADNDLLLGEIEKFHVYLGLEVAARWQLPLAPKAAILWSERPELAADTEVEPGCHVLAVANLLADALLEGSNGETPLSPEHPSITYLEITVDQLRTAYHNARKRLEEE